MHRAAVSKTVRRHCGPSRHSPRVLGSRRDSEGNRQGGRKADRSLTALHPKNSTRAVNLQTQRNKKRCTVHLPAGATAQKQKSASPFVGSVLRHLIVSGRCCRRLHPIRRTLPARGLRSVKFSRIAPTGYPSFSRYTPNNSNILEYASFYPALHEKHPPFAGGIISRHAVRAGAIHALMIDNPGSRLQLRQCGIECTGTLRANIQ